VRLGFTGTKYGISKFQEESFIKVLEALYEYTECFSHGDCVGADKRAHQIVLRLPINIHIFPPNKRIYKAFTFESSPGLCLVNPLTSSEDIIAVKKCLNGVDIFLHKADDYLSRDRSIVRNSDVLVACPGQNSEQIRSGTWYTIRQARKRKIPIYKIFPMGKIEVENKLNLNFQLKIG